MCSHDSNSISSGAFWRIDVEPVEGDSVLHSSGIDCVSISMDDFHDILKLFLEAMDWSKSLILHARLNCFESGQEYARSYVHASARSGRFHWVSEIPRLKGEGSDNEGVSEGRRGIFIGNFASFNCSGPSGLEWKAFHAAFSRKLRCDGEMHCTSSLRCCFA